MFSSSRDGQPKLYRNAADATGEVERLAESSRSQQAFSWSADGETLVFVAGDGDLHTLSFDREPSSGPFETTGFTEHRPRISPDGRWIAYDSNREGQREV